MRQRITAGCLFWSLSIVIARLASATAAEGWPHWRGPTGNATADNDASPPVDFGPEANVRWKASLPGRGSSSPVVLGERVFVTSAVPLADGSGQLDFRLLCFDLDDGTLRWSRSAVQAVPHEGTHQTNGFASASPCGDAERVYAFFGSRGLFCYTLQGEPLWSRDFGDMQIRHGFGEGSSPTLAGQLLLVPWDHEGPSRLFAVDSISGQTVWETPRDEPTCWATPLVARDATGVRQVVLNGERAARGYDLASGSELWRCGGQTVRPVASAVAAGGVAYIGSGFRGAFMGAFDLAGRGDLSGGPHVRWTLSRDTPDIASPLLSDGRLYFYKGKTGLLTCLDAADGKPHYQARRIPGVSRTYASPVAAGGHVYLTDRDGRITVIRDADHLAVVATNDVGEGVDATPAVAGERLLVRGERHLFCFAKAQRGRGPSGGRSTR